MSKIKAIQRTNRREIKVSAKPTGCVQLPSLPVSKVLSHPIHLKPLLGPYPPLKRIKSGKMYDVRKNTNTKSKVEYENKKNMKENS